MFISSSVTSFPYTECKHGGLLSLLRLSCKRNEACTAPGFVSVRGPWKVMRHGRSILFSFDMPTIFCVPGCHQKEARSRGELFVLQFPCSPLWRKQWIRGVRWDEGNDLEIAEGTKVCSLHFRGGWDHFVQLNPTEWSSYLYQIYDFSVKFSFKNSRLSANFDLKTSCLFLSLRRKFLPASPRIPLKNPYCFVITAAHKFLSRGWVIYVEDGRHVIHVHVDWLFESAYVKCVKIWILVSCSEDKRFERVPSHCVASHFHNNLTQRSGTSHVVKDDATIGGGASEKVCLGTK